MEEVFDVVLLRGGWAGGWVGYGKVEENEAVRMRCWTLWGGGWVGGWVGG